jgi:hypothetical protein
MVNMMIIALVAVGAVLFVVVNHASSGRELMPTMFLALLGAVITVQVIPGIVLLGSILKGIINLVRKQVPSEVSANNDAHK